MKVLILGGDKGSWAIRGRQLGAAINARYATKLLHPVDLDWPDVIVLVKRAPETWFQQLRGWHVPLVWDVLDFWRQPTANQRTEEEFVREVRGTVQSLNIRLVIGATKTMASAIGGVYLPHHHRIGLTPTPPRAALKVVAYDGSTRYLGPWRQALERACAELGLTFVVNPEDLTAVDLLVAFRGGDWDGWVCRTWKSGIKYVNAIAAGRPILTQASAGFQEIRPHGAIVEDPDELVEAIRSWMPLERRQQAYEDGRKRAKSFAIETIASDYLKILQGVTAGACV